MLQMLQKLCQHAGVAVASSTPQVQGFSETTDVQELASELKENCRSNELNGDETIRRKRRPSPAGLGRRNRREVVAA